MAWFKVDDKLHDHGKAYRAGKAAMGVWVLAGSWCMSAETDGFVPERVISRWGTRRDAERLVEAGFWSPHTLNGEDGWQFHDWLIYQPDARTLQLVRQAESKAGSFGNHKRWHTNRRVVDPECPHCKDPEEDTA